MITIGSSDISESTKLQLAITFKKRELLNIEKDIKQLREKRKAHQISLDKARTKENIRHIESITKQIKQTRSEIKEKHLIVINILKSIQRRYIRLQYIKREGCQNRGI